nr:alcohol dehydrogenase catalytic domain-containing protein [Chloroflexota bacterium]
MKAWRVNELGDPMDVLKLEEVDAPTAGPGEAVVEVGATSLNFFDILLCQGTYQEKPPLPFTPGAEVGGTVRAVGDGVTTVREGQRVLALPP